MECEKHSGIQIILVCITCDTALVCVDCITDELHHGHVFEKPTAIAEDIRTKLTPKEEEECKLEEILESDLDELKTLQTEKCNKQKSSIESRRDELIKSTNKIVESIILQYENQTQINCDKLQVAIDDTSTELEKVRRHRKEVKRILDEQDDLVVVNDTRILVDVEVQRRPFPSLASIEFVPGKVNTDQLKLMFRPIATNNKGEMTDVTLATDKGSKFVDNEKCQGRELVMESTFKHSESHVVVDMSNGSYGKMWIQCYDEKLISLVDNQGHVEKTVAFDVHGMTAINDNALLICGNHEHDIKKVTMPSGVITSVFSTGDLWPWNLWSAPSGDLYVIARGTNPKEKSLVRYSPLGSEKDRACYDRWGNALFYDPVSVKTSNTENTIGVNTYTAFIEDVNSHLVLLNKDLTQRLRYLGSGKVVSGEEKFDITTYKPETKYSISDFLFDSYGNIIIGEHYSKSVQLLSQDCTPIRTFLPIQEHATIAFSMNGDQVWISFADKTVRVYKYN